MMRHAGRRASVDAVGFAYNVQQHSAAGHHGGDPLVTVLWIALMCCLVAAPLAWLLRSRALARAALRRCPACGSTGVRKTTHEPLDLFEVRVRLQCGQCGAWRRLRTRRESFYWHARAVAREKRRMAKEARRQAVAELRGFAAVLRSEIVSGDDFLARTTPPRPLAGGG